VTERQNAFHPIDITGAPTAAPTPAMPPKLHHFAVIGRDAARSGVIGAAYEVPATAIKARPAIAIAEKVRIIGFLPVASLARRISDFSPA